jgi:hypothetical protein
MRTLLLACAAALTLTGCQSTEEKIQARYMNWFAACGYPEGSAIPYEAEAEVVACVRDLEASYQTERSQKIARSAALLGYGSALMAPPAPAVPSRRTCNTTVQPSGRAATTTCY